MRQGGRLSAGGRDVTVRWYSLVVDATDPTRLASSWVQALGWSIANEEPDDIAIEATSAGLASCFSTVRAERLAYGKGVRLPFRRPTQPTTRGSSRSRREPPGCRSAGSSRRRRS